jgi:DNA-binding CsgD family transcriptional regulator
MPRERGRLFALMEQFAARYGLSPREHEALCWGVRGYPSKNIAHEMHCSTRTVEEYWRRIFVKAGMRSKCQILAELVRMATTNGPTPPEMAGPRRSP